MTFVTTNYNESLRFAGICIGRPANTGNVASVGVAISGAITIRPETDDEDIPQPGTHASFNSEGRIQFGPPEDRIVDCLRGILEGRSNDESILTDDELRIIAGIRFGDGDNPAGENDVEKAADRVSRMTKIQIDLVRGRLESLRRSPSLLRSGSGPSWGRVLDTGSGGTVRLLLKLA